MWILDREKRQLTLEHMSVRLEYIDQQLVLIHRDLQRVEEKLNAVISRRLAGQAESEARKQSRRDAGRKAYETRLRHQAERRANGIVE
jgi:hypothetical protein